MRIIFEWLSPPPDGLQGLRRKLDELDENRSRTEWLRGATLFPHRSIFAASLLALTLSLGLIFNTWRAGEDEPRKDYGIFQTVMEQDVTERDAVVLPQELNPRLSLVPVESSNPKVKIYWIQERDG